jgi:hypothetical protein
MSDINVNLTRVQFEQLRTKIAAKGLNLVGDAGEATAQGVTVAYQYAEPNLSIDIVHSTMPHWMVEHSLKGWISANV